MKNGHVRICIFTNVPSEPRYYQVPNVAIGKMFIDSIAKEHLLCENDITDNVFILEVWNEELIDENGNKGDWDEWTDEEGNTERYYKINDKFEMEFEDNFS